MHYDKKILIDIETLLDVRQGVMSLISQDFSVEVTGFESYYVRTIDEFKNATLGTLSKGMVASVKQSAPEEVIRASVVTKLPYLVRDMVLAIRSQCAQQGLSFGLTFEIPRRKP